MIGHITFGPRNRDAASPSNLSLDALSSTDIARYRSGEWLGPAVRSAELPRGEKHNADPEGVAELAARAQIWVERHGEGA